MARIRSIKPEFPQSESMGHVSRDARLLFLQLFTLADDEGRLRGTPELLAGLLYPYDVVDRDAVITGIAAWLGELEREDCVVRYVVGRSHYVALTHFHEHQRIDKPTKSKLPPPPTPREDSRELARAREDSRGLHDGSGSGSGSGSGEEHTSAPAAPVCVAASPTEDLLEHWRAVAAQHGVLEPAATRPKVEHQARTLLAVHALDVLRLAVTAFWASPRFIDARNFGLFAHNAGQLVAHVQAGHAHRFGERAPARATLATCGTSWCAHDPPCQTQAQHLLRDLDAKRAAAGIAPRGSAPAARATSSGSSTAVA